MSSLLEQFAYDNLSPEMQSFDRNSRYDKSIKLCAHLEGKLLSRIGGEDKDLFKKYAEAQEELNMLTASQNFVHGYKMGLVMTAESFMGMNALYVGEDW